MHDSRRVGVSSAVCGNVTHVIEARRDTHIPHEVLIEYVEELKRVFTPEAYNLFHHNCNNFSNELATFLVGSGIPVHQLSMFL